MRNMMSPSAGHEIYMYAWHTHDDIDTPRQMCMRASMQGLCVRAAPMRNDIHEISLEILYVSKCGFEGTLAWSFFPV
jgi:hypothetical protein